VIPALAGAVLAAAFAAVLARTGRRAERLGYGASLAAAALVYVVLAIGAGASEWLALEIAGVLAFGAFAVIGAFAAPWLLAFGWALHVLWDVPLHLGEAGAFLPAFYPALCAGFDLVLAVAIALRLRRWAGARQEPGFVEEAVRVA
jgi:hypothetical protein